MTRATISTLTLGSTEVSFFLMPDASYGYTYEWLAQLIERDKSILSDKKSPYYLDSLVKEGGGKGFTNQTVSVVGISKSKFKYVTSEQLMQIFVSLVKLGHAEILNLLAACAIEALERRADAAVGKQRAEEERNYRIKNRLEGIAARRGLTDAVKDYLSTQNCSENYEKHIWHNLTDAIYVRLFGGNCKQIVSMLKLGDIKLRDGISPKALKALEYAEAGVMNAIDNGFEPIAAVSIYFDSPISVVCKL